MSTNAIAFRCLPNAATLSLITSSTGTIAVSTSTPSASGVLNRSLGPARMVPDLNEMIFGGTGADNSTFTITLLGQREWLTSWIPRKLGVWTATLSTFGSESNGTVGSTNTDFPANFRFVDTLALDSAYTALEGIAFRTVSPADNTPAAILLDPTGYPITQFHVTLGTATGAGAFLADL